MIIEKSFKKATLTNQVENADSDLSLEIIPHPAMSGCCLLSVLKFRCGTSEGTGSNSTVSQIVINNSELKTVADLL